MELALYPSLRIAVKVDDCRGGVTFPREVKIVTLLTASNLLVVQKNVSGFSHTIIEQKLTEQLYY